MSAADSHFMKKAAGGGLAEVEHGQLAQQKGSSEDFKKFGERMVTDHTKANEELKQVAAEEHLNFRQEISMKDKATKARLEKLSGEEFDRAYMKDMVTDHKADVAQFEHESKMAKDPAVKSFASSTLPVLREHLKEAERSVPKQQTAANTAKQSEQAVFHLLRAIAHPAAATAAACFITRPRHLIVGERYRHFSPLLLSRLCEVFPQSHSR